jgi:membrane fusion protein, heavy metal efflux system
MNRFVQALIIFMTTFLLPSVLFASGAHDHDESEVDHVLGVHGGRVFSDGEFSVEVLVEEEGVSVSIRAWAYDHAAPLKPEDFQLSIDLVRLGGDMESISFLAEGDSLRSRETIARPHSFDVMVSARYQTQKSQWQFERYEARTIISAREAKAAGLNVEQVGAATLYESVSLFGRIRANGEQVYPLSSRYAGLVQRVYVSEGDQVKKGDVVAQVEARDTLQSISIRSPADGIITARNVNAGMLVDADILIEVTNVDTLWLDLDAFPKDLSRLSRGQKVLLHDAAQRLPIGTLSYIAPGADVHTRSTRIRAVIENPDDIFQPGSLRSGILRPGTLVRADVVVGEEKVPLAVKRSATQKYLGETVVFIRSGDAYEPRVIDVGASDGEWVEVLGGLSSGASYVTENSFLVKADILKSGASHQH